MFRECKYTTWYFSIVSRATSRENCGYVERHHIIPKCLGGSNEKTNIVSLTGREHYLCHLLLTKMTEGDARKKMLYAFILMANHPTRLNGETRGYSKINSRCFQRLKEDFAKAVSLDKKGKIMVPKNPEKCAAKKSAKLKGRTFSEETKRKMSESAKARSLSSRLGAVWSDEAKCRASAAAVKREASKKEARGASPNTF
jgi:hypothetical protein